MKKKVTKQDIKKFWGEHKDLIIGGALVGSSLILGFTVLGRCKKMPYKLGADSKIDEKVLEEVSQFLDDVDRMGKGCTKYVPITGENFAKINNDCSIITCGAGKDIELLDVKGLIAFGNLVEAES